MCQGQTYIQNKSYYVESEKRFFLFGLVYVWFEGFKLLL